MFPLPPWLGQRLLPCVSAAATAKTAPFLAALIRYHHSATDNLQVRPRSTLANMVSSSDRVALITSRTNQM